jgi:hypothetical protein
LTGSAVAPPAATWAAGRPSPSSPETSGSSWLSWPAALGGRPAAAVAPPWPVPGSRSPAASRGAQGSSRAEPERALPIRAAASGPPISTASLPPPGPAGSSKPMTAFIPPSAAAASPGPPASPGAAAPGPAPAQRPGSCGNSRPAHVWRMPSRSLQRLAPRSPLGSPGRSAPRRARRLAGRAGSRHRHPLPDRQDNKAERTAEPALSASRRKTT